MRSSEITRNTNETAISLSLLLDGTGESECATGVGFLDHMLTLFARHGRFDLKVRCQGDNGVDDHHSVEDTGITLGKAFAGALGNGGGITRYGSFLLPMDEALVMVALDISGRAHLSYDVDVAAAKVGTFDTELVEEFLLGFTRALGLTLHVRMLAGKNAHHIIEAVFKGLGRAMAQAVTVDERLGGAIPSTKGVLI
jgi:imidazoleglycerol-phosphate dehydratase